MSDDNLKRGRGMAQLHNREHYIIGGKEREAGRKSACVVYRAIDAFYLPPKRGSDTRRKKKRDAEGGGKKRSAAGGVARKNCRIGRGGSA